MLTSCWARYRYAPDAGSALSAHSSDMEDIHNNNMNENDLLGKYLPVEYNAKKSLRQTSHFGTAERKKKFSNDLSNFHDGYNLQGLWMIPGRR
jgi:hypothetical protein